MQRFKLNTKISTCYIKDWKGLESYSLKSVIKWQVFSNKYSCPSQEQPQSEHPPPKQILNVSDSYELKINKTITLVIIHHWYLGIQNWFISGTRYVDDDSHCLSWDEAMGLQIEWNMCKRHKYKKLSHIWILLIHEEVGKLQGNQV